MIVEYLQAYPRTGIIVIALLISFFITLVNYFVMDKSKMREMKEKQKRINADMKLHKNDPTKQMELSKEMMAHSMETFKHSFKPMIITFIPIIIAFSWIKGVFSETTLGGSWFWWYLGSAIFGSIIFRKIFKLP